VCCSPNSYKYYFNQWGVNKSTPSRVKDAAIVALGKRVKNRMSSPKVYYKDHPIDKKKLARHIAATEKKKLGNSSTKPLGGSM